MKGDILREKVERLIAIYTEQADGERGESRDLDLHITARERCFARYTVLIGVAETLQKLLDGEL